MVAIELHDVYDDATLARIDRPPRRRTEPADGAGRARAAGATIAVAAGLTLGLRDLFSPPTRVEVEAVDPWLDGGSPAARVRFRWHRHPPRSTVEIRS